MVGGALYGSSKAALQLLTQSWAAEFGPRGVTVNAVAPGPIRTPGTVNMGEGLGPTWPNYPCRPTRYAVPKWLTRLHS